MDLADLRILFLGNCADPDTSENDPNASALKLRYHSEIYQLLSELCRDVIGTNDPEDLFRKKGEYDYVFSLFNRMGFRSSEIYPSAVCEYLKVPYLGATPDIRGVAENKGLFKHIAKSCGIDVARGVDFYPGKKIEQPSDFSPPYFVKPRGGANSEWIRPSSYCVSWDDAKKEIAFLLDKNLSVLVEEFIDGVNLTVPVLGGPNPQVLGVVEVPSYEKHNVLTSKEKLQDHCDISYTDKDMSYKVCDNDRVQEITSKHAAILNDTLYPLDYFRTDYRYDAKKDRLVILEINVCCDISSFRAIVFAAEKIGLSQKEMLKQILEISLSRQT